MKRSRPRGRGNGRKSPVTEIPLEACVLEVSTSQDSAQLLLEHLDAAYKLARQLTRKGDDADDLVQEACLRALRYLNGFRGGDMRPWLLKIVRNLFCTAVRRHSKSELINEGEAVWSWAALRNAERELLRRMVVQKALNTLPRHCREVLLLRELEEMSYKDISVLLQVPTGTVMSRLSRARAHLRESAAR